MSGHLRCSTSTPFQVTWELLGEASTLWWYMVVGNTLFSDTVWWFVPQLEGHRVGEPAWTVAVAQGPSDPTPVQHEYTITTTKRSISTRCM